MSELPDDILELQQLAFRYFLDYTNARNGLVADNYGAISHRCLHSDGVIDCEAFLFLRNDISSQSDFMVRELQSETVASMIYDGSEDTLPNGLCGSDRKH